MGRYFPRNSGGLSNLRVDGHIFEKDLIEVCVPVVLHLHCLLSKGLAVRANLASRLPGTPTWS